MGLFSSLTKGSKVKKKKEEAEIAKSQNDMFTYIKNNRELLADSKENDIAYTLANVFWTGYFEKEYNCAYTYFEASVQQKVEGASEAFEDFKKEACEDSEQQFLYWFNSQNYEVAQSYAQLAKKCGSQKGDIMLDVVDKTIKYKNNVANDLFHEAMVRVRQNEESVAVSRILMKAASMGLPEAMVNAAIYNMEKLPKATFNKEDIICYPDTKAATELEGSFYYGNLRWMRKAVLAKDSLAISWWSKKGSEEEKKNINGLGIDFKDTNYGLQSIPDVLPRLTGKEGFIVRTSHPDSYRSMERKFGYLTKKDESTENEKYEKKILDQFPHPSSLEGLSYQQYHSLMGKDLPKGALEYQKAMKLLSKEGQDFEAFAMGNDLLRESAKAGYPYALLTLGLKQGIAAAQLRSTDIQYVTKVESLLSESASNLVLAMKTGDCAVAQSVAEVFTGIRKVNFTEGQFSVVYGRFLNPLLKEMVLQLRKPVTYHDVFLQGLFLMYGLQVEKDEELAKTFFKKAANNGDVDAKTILNNEIFFK